MLVDIPIGLPGADQGERRCDVAARRALRERGRAVFPAPVRELLAFRDFKSAADYQRKLTGKGSRSRRTRFFRRSGKWTRPCGRIPACRTGCGKATRNCALPPSGEVSRSAARNAVRRDTKKGWRRCGDTCPVSKGLLTGAALAGAAGVRHPMMCWTPWCLLSMHGWVPGTDSRDSPPRGIWTTTVCARRW